MRTVCRMRPWHLAAIVTASLAAGCGSTNFVKTPPSYAGAPLGVVYVYSFIDVRTKDIGDTYVSAFNTELEQQLSRRGVRARLLKFEDSPVARDTSLASSDPVGLYRSTSVQVPVGAVIRANQAEEKAFGATHRLIVFPADLSRGGNIWLYTRWDVVQPGGKTVWTTTSRTNQTFGASHLTAGNAADCVSKVLAEMEHLGILGAAAPPTAGTN
jgi:hypothetical protein